MSSSSLNPKDVWVLSEKVYITDAIYRDIRNRKPSWSQAQVVAASTNEMSREISKISDSSLTSLNFLTATSGIFQINQLTGFGFLAQGLGGRKGELVLATRGTNFSTNKYDLATDANIGYGIGPGGNLVHRGFLKTFKGYQNDLVELINSLKLQGITTIHCLGHSLGGALANLNAALLKNAGYNVHLYTIGAPRVGLMGFSHDITQNIPGSQIYRVTHPGDPVAMLPVFPYLHASKKESEYQMNAGGNARIATEQHLLDGGYAGLSQLDSWAHLNPVQPLDLMNSSELQNQLNGVGGSASFSSKALQLITKGFKELAKLVGYSTLIVIQNHVSLSFTAFDLLAELVCKAVRLGKAIKDKAVSLVTAMMRFMGRTLNTAQNMTVSFLRWVLTLFVSEIGGRATQALIQAVRGVRR